jgi:hypothetical protein
MDVQTEETEELAPTIDEAVMGSAPETINLLDTITDEQEQQKIANRVYKDYDRDFRSSEKYREKRASILKLFIGMLPPSQDDGAEVHYPIVSTACIRIHARVYDQQFPSNGEFFGVRPTDATDLDRSIRVAKHLNWQILHQIPEYVPNHDACIMQWLLYGSAFTYTYWSPSKNRPCHEVCMTEDIILPYKRKSTDPSLADLPRITRILRPQRHELEADAETGYFLKANVDKLFEKMEAGQAGGNQGMEDQKSSSVQEVTDKASGVEKPDDQDDDSPRVLLEQHRWLKLPEEEKSRPVIVVIDRETKICLSIRLREDEDPEDRARYNLEQDANEASYAAAMQQYQMDLAAYEMTQTPLPIPGEMTSTPMPMMGEMGSTGPMVPPPMPPEQPPPPALPKMVPVHFFTHYICIPNPEGVYGYGIGFLLEGHNMVADTVASQMVDAGTLANSSTFVYSRQAKLSRGEFRIRIGEGTQTDLSPQDLKNGFHFLDFKGPNPALGNFIKDQQEAGTELSGASEILSGEVGGSNETATTTQIRISQALQAIAILNKRYTRARTVEGQKLARLNSVYLGDDEYFTVVDPSKAVPPGGPVGGPGMPPMGGPPGMPPMVGAPTMGGAPPPMMPPPNPAAPLVPLVEREQIARRDYLEDVDITITADPRMASQPQRLAEAEAAFNLVNSSPFLSQNPFLMAAVARKVFRAIDDPELIAALQMAPMMAPMMGPPPGAGGPPPPKEGGKPQPEDPGQAVPNAGPTPANQGMTA